jgi:hypothetical protein
MNRNYVYWDLEPTSRWDPVLSALPTESREFILDHPASFWDQIYNYYKPQFDALGVFAGVYSPGFAAAAAKAKGYFEAMTFGLADGHFRIYFYDGAMLFPGQTRFLMNSLANDPIAANAVFGTSNLSQTAGGIDEASIDLATLSGYFSTYDFVDAVIAKYLDSPFEQIMLDGTDLPNMLAPTNPLKIVSGKITHSNGKVIPYFFINYCYLYQLANWDITDPTSKIYQAKKMINDFFASLTDPDVVGVIVDVRGNTGGDPMDNPYLFARMIDKPLTYVYSRSKSGEGRLDYSPWMPVEILPAPANLRLKNTNVPIALLSDRGTFSGAEFHTLIVKSMSNGRVVGETTNGSSSHTVDSLIYNGGGFSGSPFFTQVSGSVVQFKSPDGKIYEGFGIPPDIDVPMTRADWENFYGGAKKDPRLEAAIRYVDPAHTF